MNLGLVLAALNLKAFQTELNAVPDGWVRIIALTWVAVDKCSNFLVLRLTDVGT